MLPPAPDDFWTRVVAEVARQIWLRETSRTVSISASMQNIGGAFSHDTRKPWHAPADVDAAASDLSA